MASRRHCLADFVPRVGQLAESWQGERWWASYAVAAQYEDVENSGFVAAPAEAAAAIREEEEEENMAAGSSSSLQLICWHNTSVR